MTRFRIFGTLLLIALLLVPLLAIADLLWQAREFGAFATLIGIPFAAVLNPAVRFCLKACEAARREQEECRCYTTEVAQLLRHTKTSMMTLLMIQLTLPERADGVRPAPLHFRHMIYPENSLLFSDALIRNPRLRRLRNPGRLNSIEVRNRNESARYLIEYLHSDQYDRQHFLAILEQASHDLCGLLLRCAYFLIANPGRIGRDAKWSGSWEPEPLYWEEVRSGARTPAVEPRR